MQHLNLYLVRCLLILRTAKLQDACNIISCLAITKPGKALQDGGVLLCTQVVITAEVYAVLCMLHCGTVSVAQDCAMLDVEHVHLETVSRHLQAV